MFNNIQYWVSWSQVTNKVNNFFTKICTLPKKEMFGKNMFKKFLHENLIWKFIFAKKCLDQANQDLSIPKSSRPLFFSKLGESFAIRNQCVILCLLYQKLCSGSKYCRDLFSSFKTVILLCLGVILLIKNYFVQERGWSRNYLLKCINKVIIIYLYCH